MLAFLGLDSLLEGAAKVIEAAGKSNLAFASLLVLVLAYLIVKLFGGKDAPQWLRIGAFLVMIACIFSFIFVLVVPVPKKQDTQTPNPLPSTTTQAKYASCVETYESRAADGWGINWSAPVLFCTPEKPDGWEIARLVDFHTTDGGSGRSCDFYGRCTTDKDTKRQICKTLTVQGHNEVPNPSNGHGWLVGHMTVEWKQPIKGDEDPKASCNAEKQIVRELGLGDKLEAGN
jgi:hypothetical protein